jgi:stalled ribosome rescue protein Dom34
MYHITQKIHGQHHYWNGLLRITTNGAKLYLVSDRSDEGSRFVKGFGGLGGILRYDIAFEDYISE